MMGKAAAKKVVPAPNTMEFSEFTKGSSTPSDSRLENFDVAPDSPVVFPSRYLSTEAKPSPAKASQKSKGVYSHDPILNRNPDELWRFLASNLKPPRLAVRLAGSHTETTTRHTGHGVHHYTETITDFSMLIDISGYVSHWSQICTDTPNSKSRKPSVSGGHETPPLQAPTVREVLEEYTGSQNLFKEFRMRKLVLWDYERVTGLLTDLVRSTGYRHAIDVHFPMDDYKVVALAPNGCSRTAHSKVVQGLCCMSCLCIVFWPAWTMARKRMENRLTCEYRSRASADEFFSRNCAMIHSAVVQKRRRETMVAL